MTTTAEAGLVVDRLAVHAGAGSADEEALRVPPGRLTALVGPAADDLSRVLAMIAGRGEASGGRVRLDGAAVPARPRPELVGYVSRGHPLVGTLTAAENLVTTLMAQDAATAARWRRAEHALAAVGLPAAAWHNLVEQLSGGQQQRVGVARALVSRPRLLVLDDPTSELDPDSAAQVVEALRAAARRGACVLVSSDDPVVLDACASRRLVSIQVGPSPPGF